MVTDVNAGDLDSGQTRHTSQGSFINVGNSDAIVAAVTQQAGDRSADLARAKK